MKRRKLLLGFIGALAAKAQLLRPKPTIVDNFLRDCLAATQANRNDGYMIAAIYELADSPAFDPIVEHIKAAQDERQMRERLAIHLLTAWSGGKGVAKV